MAIRATRATWAIIKTAAGVAAVAVVFAALVCCERKKAIIIDRDPRLPPALAQTRKPDAKPDNNPGAPRLAPLSQPPRPAAEFVHVQGPGYEGYVRPAVSAGHWQPDARDIAAMEARVPEAVAVAQAGGDVPKFVDLATYTRQYSGYTKDSSEVIEVLFVCAESKHLAARDVRVSGGGACFVKTAYTVATGRFRYWSTHSRRSASP
jgi:hypothetical protein